MDQFRSARDAESVQLAAARQAVEILDETCVGAARLIDALQKLDAADGVPLRAPRAAVNAWLDALRPAAADHPRARELPRLVNLAREHVTRLPFAEDAPTPALASDRCWVRWAAHKGCADVVLGELLAAAEQLAAELRGELDAADERAHVTATRVRASLRRERARGLIARASAAARARNPVR